MPVTSVEIMKTIDERKLQKKKTKKTKKKPKKKAKEEKSKGTEAIVKRWEINDSVVHLS